MNRAALFLCLFFATTNSAFAQSNALEKCKGVEVNQVIEGCTEVIEKKQADGEGLADIYGRRANAYGAMGKFEEAFNDFARAIELKPQDADLYYYRGILHSQAGDHAKSIGDLDKSLELKPGSAVVLSHRGYVHSQQGNHDAAIADLTAVIELNPKNP